MAVAKIHGRPTLDQRELTLRSAWFFGGSCWGSPWLASLSRLPFVQRRAHCSIQRPPLTTPAPRSEYVRYRPVPSGSVLTEATDHIPCRGGQVTSAVGIFRWRYRRSTEVIRLKC